MSFTEYTVTGIEVSGPEQNEVITAIRLENGDVITEGHAVAMVMNDGARFWYNGKILVVSSSVMWSHHLRVA
ncbi:hypothetical protein [Novosphingobium clariflavum]|uniref:Uncharacterized protein n=1 Tax=Novosphingobium clariflavum TaxID=2029884 RepID=A0ABV6S983_9SPHN|nr:hypothetical protein [Novosphingobium clariflavum]